jgi:NitT/TauT family transport system substrate-binding protein
MAETARPKIWHLLSSVPKWALLASALLALLGCSKPPVSSPAAAGVPKAATKVRFKNDWFPIPEQGGFYQASVKGLYKDAGLDVDLVQGGPGVTVPQLLISGQVDISMAASDDVIVWCQQNLPFVIVGVYMERDPQALLLHDEDPARGFADLNHRTIMVSSGAHFMDYLRMKYGLELRQIPLNYGLAEFMADKTFIQQCFVTHEPYYVQQHGGHPRTLLLSESGYNSYRIIFTTRSYLREHEETVRRFVAASLRGWDEFMNGDASQARALIERLNPSISEGYMDFAIRTMRDQHIVFGKPEAGERLGLMTRGRMQEQVDILAKLGILSGPIPLDRFVRFDLLPQDLQKESR